MEALVPIGRRIERASELLAVHAFAREVLEFYIRIAQFQSTVREDFDHLADRMPELLSVVESFGPAPLAVAVAEVRARGNAHWRSILTAAGTPAETFLANALLQPYMERLDWVGQAVSPAGSSARLCPRCGSRPGVGVLRPEGHGAKRTLLCSLCSLEWQFPRIECPACGEQSAKGLAIYTAEQFEAVRVEACEKCRIYLTCVDLTRNALAVPQVDELAMIPLDLWAREQGYVKLQTNLFGL
ncbi:MAG: formate dehydrogenase accessory protein FdhE [Bryobacterales bacterium]|nr:formate dehydrogenase accessory protein FdhE [Bryobacterales bacterium]